MIPHAFEGAILGVLAFWQGSKVAASLVSESDWNKIFGPNGVAFVAVIAVIVLWFSKVRSDSRNERARDRRHNEMVAANQKNTDDLKELTAESIKAQMKAVAVQTEAVGAMKTLANNFSLLHMEVKGRPCQKKSELELPAHNE